MSQLIKLEVQRLKHFWGHILAFHGFVVLSLWVVITQQNSGALHLYSIYAVIPILVLSSTQISEMLLPGALLQEWCFSQEGGRSCQISIIGLSICHHLPLSLLLWLCLSEGTQTLLVLWLLLDILSGLSYCIRMACHQAAGAILHYLLLLPMCLPWLTLGHLVLLGSVAALKLLFAAWLLYIVYGYHAVLFCHKIAGCNENAF